MNKGIRDAANLHEKVPPGWYFNSIRRNILQRYWHTRRFGEVTKLIDSTKGRILDIGCADGVFTYEILKKSEAHEIIAIDVLEESISWAKKQWRNEPKIKFMVVDAHNLKFDSTSFDAVFALEVLEHVYRPLDVLKEIKRVLKKGGYAVFLVPSDSLLFRVLWEFFWTNTRGKIWKDTHIHSFRKDYLVRLAKEAGFKVEVSKKFISGMLHLVKVRKLS